MRLPNGYGSVIKLGGKRRKPWAVRITNGYKEDARGMQRQCFKYLEYFEKSKDAYAYLADYNAGHKVQEHVALTALPTFADIYEKWYDFKTSRNRKLAEPTVKNYQTAFRQLSDLHHLKFRNIRLEDLQASVDKYKNKSASTINSIMTVLRGMYGYAMKYELVEKDYAALVTAEWTATKGNEHIPFTKEEIALLWDRQEEADVYVVLILIYTGLRMSEFLSLKTENIHLGERYFTGGMKTDAGTNRIVPIHEKLVPFFEAHLDQSSTYFYPTPRGTAYDFNNFYAWRWKNLMSRYGMNHRPHDTRHTCATLMANAGINDFHRKLILGHAVSDITNRVYTHVATADLVADINLI